MEETKALSPEILEGIKPFSGEASEMLPAERMLRNGLTLQKVGTQYATAVAVQKRRSLPAVVSNVLEEAELAGEAFYYGWHVNTKQGKRWIQGGSISLATSIARNWGNSVVDAELVEETPTHHILKGYFIDLETGVTFGRPFRQRKQPNIGAMGDDVDRKEDISFQIGLSKASRNAVFEGVPRWLVDRAIERAKEAVKKGLGENLEIARAEAIKYFKRYGISQERIESTMGKLADNWTPEHLVELKGMATALKEGRVTPEELFPEEDTAPPREKPGEDKTEPSEKDDPIRMKLEPEDLSLYDELKNVRSSSLEVRVIQGEELILRASQKFQYWLKNVKWKNVYKEAKPYPLDNKENAATGEIAPPGGENEGTELPSPSAEDKAILSLIEGAKLDIANRLCVPCPNKDGRAILFSHCEEACGDREGCPTFEEYDKKD